MLEHMETCQKVKDGIKNLVSMLQGNSSAPISFQRFLEQTGLFFDHYILAVSHQESLDYVGGKMILQLEHGERKVVDGITIRLFADLYFQTADEQWIVKQKQGQVDSARFMDWDSDKTAIILQQAGKVELSIELPDT